MTFRIGKDGVREPHRWSSNGAVPIYNVRSKVPPSVRQTPTKRTGSPAEEPLLLVLCRVVLVTLALQEVEDVDAKTDRVAIPVGLRCQNCINARTGRRQSRGDRSRDQLELRTAATSPRKSQVEVAEKEERILTGNRNTSSDV